MKYYIEYDELNLIWDVFVVENEDHYLDVWVASLPNPELATEFLAYLHNKGEDND